jgi:hypothetical protein
MWRTQVTSGLNFGGNLSGSEKKVTQYNVGHYGKILANLHNQNKSVEQLKNEYRSIEESDAEIAVKCLAQIVRDLGWAQI